MTAARWCGVACGAAALLITGCGMGPKDQQIEAQQARINELERDKANLISQLQQAQSERADAIARALELQRMLDDAKRQLAQGPAGQEGRWTTAGPYAWTDISENILFDSGKADLKATGRAELQQVAREIQEKFPERNIWIVGHTDTDPIRVSKWKDNLELSVQRGATVHRELMKLGLDPQRLIAGGQGEWNPKVDNSTRANKALNRRVQIIAVQKPEQVRPGALQPAGEQG